MSALQELQDLATSAAGSVGPSVVAVGRGAGVVVGRDRVLTNAHNLTDHLEVRFADGATAAAEPLAHDVDGDLAVLAVPTGERPPVVWADAPPTLGTAVAAIGAPRSGTPRVTLGFVSATEQRFRGPRGRHLSGVEHTAPRARGSSGGPIVTADGRVAGLDTHRRGDGLYLALPASDALRRSVARLAAGETSRRRHLGVAVAPPATARRMRAAVGLEPRDGVLVREVDADGPAARAGLREGDLLVRAADRTLAEPGDLLDVLDDPADPLTIAVVRGVDELEVTITFAAGGPEEPRTPSHAPDTDDHAEDDQ